MLSQTGKYILNFYTKNLIGIFLKTKNVNATLANQIAVVINSTLFFETNLLKVDDMNF